MEKILLKNCGRMKNYIFGIFFLCLLFCGVCVDDVSAASFCHTKNDMTQDIFMPEGDVVLSQEVWEEDEILLQQRELRMVQYAKRDNYRGCWRNIVALLVIGFSLSAFGSIYSITERQLFMSGFSHKFIIGYIHQSDGEKSC